MRDRSCMPVTQAIALADRAWNSDRRRQRNRAHDRCINDNARGSHGAATHGVRCRRCYAVHKGKPLESVPVHYRRTYSARSSYLSLDEILYQPRIRILRAMRWFDWVSSDEIRVAIDEPNANAVAATIRRLLRNREVERSGTHMSYQYRITPTGKRNLQATMRRARP